MYLIIDDAGFNKKPTKEEAKAISKRIASCTRDVTMEQLAQMVTGTDAKTWIPALIIAL